MKSVTFLLFSIFSLSTFSTPFFYKCGEDGILKDKIQPEEISHFLKRLVATKGEQEAINYLCKSNKVCMEEFKRIITLGIFTKRATKKLLDQLQTSQTNIYAQKISDDQYNYASSIQKLGQSLLTCQENKKNLDPDSLARDKCFSCSEKVVLFYPYYNNYMYISGCEGLKDEEKCDHILDLKAVKESINRSLIMGADPYATLAIGVMEKFNRNFSTSITWEKTIPPRFWLSGAMGCHGKSAKDGVREIYGANGKVVSQSTLDLGQRLNSYIENNKGRTTKGTSYFCYKQGESSTELRITPKENSCCLELPFKFSGNPDKTKSKVQSAMMFHYIKTHTNSPLSCKKQGENAKKGCQKGRWNRLYEKDPSFNIQRFQGYSKLHGGDEPVNAWRSGVNHYKTPVYGYQVMDYLINSLYTNPLLSELVNNAQKKLNVQKPKSLICANSKPGVYVVDGDMYFKLGRDAKRLSTVFDVKDKSWKDLTRAQRRVMLTEFGDPTVRNGDQDKGTPGLLSHFSGKDKETFAKLTDLDFSTMSKLIRGVWKNEKKSQEEIEVFNRAKEIYFDKYYGPRESRGKASAYPWKRIDEENFEKLIRKLN